MSRIERLNGGAWMGLQSGNGLPAFAWGSPFKRTFETSNLRLRHEASGLVVIALGQHESNHAHVEVGDLSEAETAAIWESLRVDQDQPALPQHKRFGRPYGELITNPGVKPVDVVLAAALGDEVHVSHLGPSEKSVVAERLLPYTKKIMTRMGIKPPAIPDLSRPELSPTQIATAAPTPI